MDHADLRAAPPEFRGDLQLASGIPQDYVIGAGRDDIVGLAPRELTRHRAFGQVVAPRRSATQIRLREFDQFDSRN